jgi:hypothetical protein
MTDSHKIHRFFIFFFDKMVIFDKDKALLRNLRLQLPDICLTMQHGEKA